ncbi:MAG TPA: ABC transporter substrate binding protein [Anaeromyxobacter sp.]
MRTRHRSRLALAVAMALLVRPASIGAAEPDVCVVVSGDEHAAVADAAQHALGQPARRVDVRDRAQRAALASSCGRLIIAVGSEALRAAGESAPRSPVVHVMAGNGRGTGLPGVLPDADPRRVLETLRKLAPSAHRIGMVFNPDLTGELVADAQASARPLGMELVALPARTVGEAVRAFQRFERELSVDALWLLPDGTATVQETVYYALELAHWRRLVVIGLSRWYVASGALFALLPRPDSSGTVAGELGQQVLRGTPPSGAVHARDYALYLNQRAATRLGLKLPRQLLESADQVLP